MMNSDFIMQQTGDFAEQVLHETHLDRAGKVKLVYERVFSRPASELEVSRALAYLDQYRQELEPLKMKPEEQEQRTWQSLCRVLISSNEFLFVD